MQTNENHLIKYHLKVAKREIDLNISIRFRYISILKITQEIVKK